MDFTQKIYKELLESLKDSGYTFQTFEQFVQNPGKKVVVLRHDVDKLPQNGLDLAKIEHSLGLQASYYYRIVKESNQPRLIEAVRDLGHEIGYHYEDLTLAKGDKKKAIDRWEKNLAYFRRFYPVTTACMHGSPMSKWDNRLIWEDYNYKDYGIIAEPYFDIDYHDVFYITDTGRSWNSTGVSVRDKVDSGFHIEVESTPHFISLAKAGKLPPKIIINTHPQRWFDPGFGWFRELVLQNLKNQVKRLIVQRNG
ncbi:MAG: hypothetical protein P8100_02710 [bacterium]